VHGSEGQGAEKRIRLMWTEITRHRRRFASRCRKEGCENGESEMLVGTERSARDRKCRKKAQKTK
jgi:hypothetical protein